MAEVQLTPFQLAIEKWLPIPGWEALYMVSDYGRVKSLDRIIVCKNGVRKPKKGRILKVDPDRRGHLFVSLHDGDRHRSTTVHRLMLEAFVGPCPPGHEVLHHNDIADDNRLDNLRYGTRYENVQDMKRNRGHHNAVKTHCKHGHELADRNRTAASRGKGHRACLACSRTRGYLRNHPEFKDHFDLIAGQYYDKIMRQ